MGKCTRKAKMTVDVALMDVSQSYLGVRTRAKTLALKRLQTKAAAAATDAAPPPSKPDACYLELRSRRLEKPMQQQSQPNAPQGCGCAAKEDSQFGSREECFRAGSTEGEGFGIEASFGENDLDSQPRERGTRESTPCSIIRVSTPGSTSKKKCSGAATQRFQNAFPCAYDLDQFFALEEQPLQRHFTEKYNFDFVNDVPLAGRYEWVEVKTIL